MRTRKKITLVPLLRQTLCPVLDVCVCARARARTCVHMCIPKDNYLVTEINPSLHA